MRTDQSYKSALVISYTGMLEPLGQSQVLAYQERLAADRPIHLISFERDEDWARLADREALQLRLERVGIHWHPMRYHKRLSVLATAWDIACGTWKGWRLVRSHQLVIIHARSYIPAVMALLIKYFTGAKFLFDIRGFWADERVDGGLWPRDGGLYRIAKWFEQKLLLKADHVVSLTHAAVSEMQTFDYLKGRIPPMTVIPTCADLGRFTRQSRPVGSGGFTLGYVGSAGTWYLFDAVVATFSSLAKSTPGARILIVNRNEHAYIHERLKAGGLDQEYVRVCAAQHAEVPGLMAQMDAGIFFYKPSYSRAACSPTKLGEFLGCGIPCLSNTGVGDMAEILEGDRVGVAVDDFEPETLERGMQRLLTLLEEPDIHERCIAAAQRHFSLEQGVAKYRSVYRSLTSGHPCAS